MDRILEINNLQSGYNQKVVLRDINLQVKRGAMVGIIGPNGCGKSTLLKSIRGIIPLMGGQIDLFGQQIHNYATKDLAKKIAYLQQNHHISFSYTVRELVMSARYPYLKWWQKETNTDRQIVEQCMQCTGVTELAAMDINNLSGGQKQRVFLAKVLAQQSPLLFLDEPTTGLDMIYQEEILRFCQAFCQSGKTIMAVLHDLSLAAKYCSHFVLISGGQLIATGTPGEVLTAANLSKAYNSPIKVYQNPLSGNFEISSDSLEHSMERRQLLQNICQTEG